MSYTDASIVYLHGGRRLVTHGASGCVGEHCVIHDPSDHPLRDAPLEWRSDRYPPFMERICSHGIGHPDPDSLAYMRLIQDPDEYENACFEIHGCDGCCAPQGKD